MVEFTVKIPTDYSPASHSIVESQVTLPIPTTISTLLTNLSTTLSTTPSTLILSSFSLLLYRYTLQSNYSISLHPQRTLLHLSIPTDDTFSDLVSHVTNSTLSATLLPSDSTANSIRYSVIATNTPLPTINITTSDQVTLLYTHSTLIISFNALLYSEQRMTELLEQILYIITQSTPTTPLLQLSLTTPTSHSILPDTSRDLYNNWIGSITHIFQQNSLQSPNAPCVVTSTNTYTYSQIHSAVLLLSHHLLHSGIQQHDIVMIYATRSVELVIAIMSVLTVGATFSVLDPAYPPQRQTVYLSVAKPRGLIILQGASVDKSVAEFITRELNVIYTVPCLHMTSSGTVELGITMIESVLNSKPVNVPIGPDSIATLSFTSGSTGIPKAVRGRHYSLTAFYPFMQSEFNLSSTDHFSMLSGIAHDPIQRDIFTPLFFGAQIHIPTITDIATPGQLATWMSIHCITVTHLTPAMGQLLSANATTLIPTLLCAFFVGDVLTRRDVVRLQSLANNCTVVNMYGTTETQRAVSFYSISPVSGVVDCLKDSMPAGRGMDGVQLVVVNRQMQLCGVGEMGEIYVRSCGLSEGYLGLEDATSERFVFNWFVDNHVSVAVDALDKGKRDRMYKTGDVGRYRADGNVECCGRADDQVKIRGFRIELGEIDIQLSRHVAVRENVTLVKRDKNEEKTLIAYVVLHSHGVDVGAAILDIREFLKKSLPVYAVPSVIFPLKKMPLTPNGKVDKNALPFPDTLSIVTSRVTDSESFTETENKVFNIWCKLLSRSEFTLDDHFFDIGGHSIMATRLIFELRREFGGLEVPLGLVFSEPTVRGMSRELDGLRGNDLNVMTSPIREEGVENKGSYAEDYERLVSELPEFERVGGEVGGRVFFLTGATGFLGIFILSTLLEKIKDAQVYCLARAKSDEAATERVWQTARDHLLFKEEYKHRVVGVAGDLGKERLGLPEEMWNRLAKQVDVFIHNGALVHWVYPYEKLRPMNVQSTIEGLRFCLMGKTKSFHFVSSTSVLDTPYYIDGDSTVFESDDLEGSRTGLTSGYGQSKWVSEKLVMEMQKRGFPATIIRPGYIVGDSKSGVTNADDFIWRLVKGCIELKAHPVMLNPVNMCPVDYVALCVVEAATEKTHNKRNVFHTRNNSVFRFSDLFDLLVKYGYELNALPYVEWRSRLMNVTLTENSALFPLLHFVLDDLPTNMKAPPLDDGNVRGLLEGKSTCGVMGEELIGIYLRYLVAVGFLDETEKVGRSGVEGVRLITRNR